MIDQEYLESLREGRADVERQLESFERGLHISVAGNDVTQSHINGLQKIKAEYDEMIEAMDA